MLALPPAPTPARPRMQLVATGLVCAAGAMLMAMLVGAYLWFRSESGGTTATWVPEGVATPMVAATTLLFTMIGLCVLAQWAVYAIARDDRTHTLQALGLTFVFGVAAVNAQTYLWRESGITIRTDETAYAVTVLSLTGTWVALAVAGLVYTLVMAFRSLGGRTSAKDVEGIAALAMYWYFVAAAFAAVWYVVYILK